MSPETEKFVSPPIIAPSKMLEERLPSMIIDPRHASSCIDVRPEKGIIKKRRGFTPFSIANSANGSLSGRIQGLYQSPFGWIDDIVVLSQYRGRGIAGLLIKEIIRIARDENCYKVFGYAWPEVVSLYRRFNFEELHTKIEIRFTC